MFFDGVFPISFFLHNLESSNFLRRYEYIERKTPSKCILEFLKHFSSRSHHKLFLDHPVYVCYTSGWGLEFKPRDLHVKV